MSSASTAARGPVPSRMTVHRILVRHGLIDPTVRKRRRQDYRRWQRDAPLQLWQLDIVGGLSPMEPSARWSPASMTTPGTA